MIETTVKKIFRGKKACTPAKELYTKGFNGVVRKGGLTFVSQGRYGTVYKGCLDDRCQTKIAVKITSEQSAKMEYSITKKLKGMGVPEMYHFKSCDGEDILYFEYVDGENMRTFFSETKRSLDEYKSVMFQVLTNLQKIQEKFPTFRHHDLHGKNILVRTVPVRRLTDTLSNMGLEAIIIDFGFSTMKGIKNPLVNTKQYKSIGIVRNSSPSYDVHYFLNEMYNLTRGGRMPDVRVFITSILPTVYLGPTTNLVNMYRLRGNANNSMIPSIKTILNHPFFMGRPRPRPRPRPITRVAPPPPPPPNGRTAFERAREVMMKPKPSVFKRPTVPVPESRPKPKPTPKPESKPKPKPKPESKPKPKPTPKLSMNKDGDLKIGTRKCRLYTKKDLVNLFNLDPKRTKEQMCTTLKKIIVPTTK